MSIHAPFPYSSEQELLIRLGHKAGHVIKVCLLRFLSDGFAPPSLACITNCLISALLSALHHGDRYCIQENRLNLWGYSCSHGSASLAATT